MSDEWTADVAQNGPSPTAQLFARLFRGEDGQQALDYLKRQTVERQTSATITDAELRFLEGQRSLVLLIQSLINIGRQS